MTEARAEEDRRGLARAGRRRLVRLEREGCEMALERDGLVLQLRGRHGFPEFGLNLNRLPPGAPMAMYHHEPHQEGFLVLEGEAILIVEGEEQRLKRWDMHLPATVPHVIVGAGDGALVLAAGSRVGGGGATYPVDEAAARSARVWRAETSEPREAYVHYSADGGPSPYPGAARCPNERLVRRSTRATRSGSTRATSAFYCGLRGQGDAVPASSASTSAWCLPGAADARCTTARRTGGLPRARRRSAR